MLGILGTTALLLDSGPDATWGGQRERAVLATLAVHAGDVVPVEVMLRWVWPRDKPAPVNPEPMLDTCASRIRRVLERLPSPPRLRFGLGGYRLEIERARIDLNRFRDLAAEARAFAGRDPARAVDLVDDALWLWRGLPLADLHGEPALAWRERLMRDEWLATHTVRVRALLQLGRHEEAVAALNELQVDYPDDLELANLRLTGLYGRRRFADATRYYLATRHKLGAEEQVAHRRHRTALADAHSAPVVPTPTRVPRQLPGDVADLVGRRVQLSALAEAGAGQPGVVILDGAGGVGKTTLAVHWAHRVRARFPGGELFANLGGSDERTAVEPAAVVDDFLTALGQRPDPALTRAQRAVLLRRLLADRRTLVVLDNVRDSEQVLDLLHALPSCLVLVTSRQRLSRLRAATGARRVTVPPMNAGESTALLSVHARDRVPPHRMIDLCGGLPLAITVFAARLNRGKLLTAVGDHGGVRTAGDSCLLTSYRTLAEPERRLFRLLSLHLGADISVPAACAIDDRAPTATLRSLVALVDAGLLGAPDEFDRFRRHDRLAEFAASRLTDEEPPGAVDAAVVRLLDFYIASVTHAARAVLPSYVAPPDQPDPYTTEFVDEDEAVEWLCRERTALVAAVRQADEHGCVEHVWRLAHPVAACFDAAGWLVESAVVRELAAPAVRGRGWLRDLGRTYLTLGALDDADRCLTAAPLDASVLSMLAELALARGEAAAALASATQAVRVATGADAVCWARLRAGQALRVTGQPEAAADQLGQALAAARQCRDGAAELACLVELAGLHRDHDTAVAYCDEALAVAETHADLPAAARMCVTVARLCVANRQFARAVAYARRGVSVVWSTQHLAVQAEVVAALGDALHGSGEPHEAAATWRQAASLYEHVDAQEEAEALRDKAEQVWLPGPPSARTESPVATFPAPSPLPVHSED